MPSTDPPAPAAVPDERPSKTQLKKQSHDLQALGLALAEMPDARLAELPVDETLIEAVREYRRTRSHEGRRRQLQYVGKLMRHVDPAPLREAVAALQVPRAEETLALHQAELWRDQLIADDAAVTRWIAEHPQTDVQRLRSLVRAARKEATASPEQRHGRSYRELFQLIKQEMRAAS
jgi:ribosome-associated protein